MSHRTKAGNRAPSSKIGRNKFKCEKYRTEGRKEKNAKRDAARHQHILDVAQFTRFSKGGLAVR